MEHHRSPGSNRREFVHSRTYPELPPNYDWETQKQNFCPRDLVVRTLPQERKLSHPFGYVFCHRGLYERASSKIENSISAIKNGTDQGLFLHEVDAFVFENLNEAFVAHDKIARRLTSKKGLWESYNIHQVLKTSLVTRRVGTALGDNGTEIGTPDFASSYVELEEKVLGLLATLLEQRSQSSGYSLQIDLRDKDLAKMITDYSYHASAGAFHHPYLLVSRPNLMSNWFMPTILKGYNIQFTSFNDLQGQIKKNALMDHGWDGFTTDHLYVLPPLIMVFPAAPLMKLAEEKAPQLGKQKTYELVRSTFMEQVSSFVHVGELSYNFILEIAHSGLGLQYDVETGKARNPLNGVELQDKDVLLESLVDRAMIEVSLELRKRHPELLFSSCTRLPDVITPQGNFKASFQTSRLEPWKHGEKGLSTKLRAVHGGLYPQSHLVVADDPAAEIAARTWIDQHWRLNREELLRMPYDDWILQAQGEIPKVIQKYNSIFKPNQTGHAIYKSDRVSNNYSEESTGISSPVKEIRSRSKEVLTPNVVLSLDATDRHSGHTEGGNKRSMKVVGQVANVPGVDLLFAAARSTQTENQGVDKRQLDSSADRRDALVSVSGGESELTSVDRKRRAFLDLAVNEAASEGDMERLRGLVASGADINARFGFNGTPIGAASAEGHLDIVNYLLHEGAVIDRAKVLYPSPPLALASSGGHEEVLKTLLKALPKIPKDSSVLGDSLRLACEEEHVSVVKLLLDNIDLESLHGLFDHTALHTVCYKGNMEIISLLLKSGADVNTYGGFHRTALGAACAGGHLAIVELLLEKGALIHNEGRRSSPLEFASKFGHHTIVKMLLGMLLKDHEYPYALGISLHYACEGGHVPVVESLLRYGADVEFLGGEYYTALQAACFKGHIEIVNILLKENANVNAYGGFYSTALGAAHAGGQHSVIDLLLERGADPDYVDIFSRQVEVKRARRRVGISGLLWGEEARQVEWIKVPPTHKGRCSSNCTICRINWPRQRWIRP